MSDVIIRAENLGKKYTIGHQAENGRYMALRDVLVHNAKSLWYKTKDLVSGKPIIQGDTTEEVWALRDVNFEIKRGEAAGIIGRNGAGKSTLLKILSRITEPTTGRLTIKGRVASLLEVGTGFHPELSGRENIYLNGTILGMTRTEIKRKFDEIVAFAEVEKYLDTPVKRYSSGMYVRLAFAVAAHLEPEILVVDEVLAVGDAQFQKKCLGKMEDVSIKEGRTVLFVSHNMAAVHQLCSKGILLDAGMIRYQGSQDRTIGQYMENVSASINKKNKNYHHSKGDGRAHITRIRINDYNDCEPIIPIYGNIAVSIDYSINGQINELDFFILIYASDGDVELGIFQRDSDCLFKPLGETGTIKVSFVNNLTPGKYIISAGIFDKARQFVDWVEHIESFQVESAFEDGRTFDKRLGKTTQQGTWAIIDEKCTAIIQTTD